ncbi:MAG TPA: hypothetical protein VF476_14190 [Chitinophagaceae bacterium]
MIKHIAILILLAGCADNKPAQIRNEKELPKGDLVLPGANKVIIQYDLLKEDFLRADSVLLVSHHSPNMPIKNSKTHEYYKKSIAFIEHDTINYFASVQERKKLNRKETEELITILIIPAINNSITFTCFQPRNAVVVFKGDKMSCFDFCFDCYGFATYGSFRSGLLMNAEKYEKLWTLYKKYNFKYELE